MSDVLERLEIWNEVAEQFKRNLIRHESPQESYNCKRI